VAIEALKDQSTLAELARSTICILTDNNLEEEFMPMPRLYLRKERHPSRRTMKNPSYLKP